MNRKSPPRVPLAKLNGDSQPTERSSRDDSQKVSMWSRSAELGLCPSHLSKVLSTRKKCLEEVVDPKDGGTCWCFGPAHMASSTQSDLAFLWSDAAGTWRDGRWLKTDRLHEWLGFDERMESSQQRVLNGAANSWLHSCHGWFSIAEDCANRSYDVVLPSTWNYSFLFFLILLIFFKKAVQKIYIARTREVNHTSTYGSFQFHFEDSVALS